MRHGVQSIVGVLVPRGVRAGTDAGQTRATEGHGRRLILCTRHRTDPISGFANNGLVATAMVDDVIARIEAIERRRKTAAEEEAPSPSGRSDEHLEKSAVPHM